MIVLDASACVEILLGSEIGLRALEQIEGKPEVHVPEHFHIEVLSVLSRYSLAGELREPRAGQMLASLAKLRTVRYPNMMLASAIWELRTSLTAYDAAYLALARTIDAQLLTFDVALASAARAEGRAIEVG